MPSADRWKEAMVNINAVRQQLEELREAVIEQPLDEGVGCFSASKKLNSVSGKVFKKSRKRKPRTIDFWNCNSTGQTSTSRNTL